MNMTQFQRLFALLCLALAVQTTSPALAQEPSPDTDDNVRQIAKQLNCPTCAGRNLADCPTETCRQWKTEIKAQLDSGKTQQEVMSYFQTRFGDSVLQSPPKSGESLLLWAVPIGTALILLAGGSMLATRLTAARKPVIAQTSAAASDDYVAELERQVKDAA
jgi:cytochrome c-type biogenesis protein CcmH